VDTVVEDPFCSAEAPPHPVGGLPREPCLGEGAEGAISGLELEAELPRLDDEELLEVFPVVPGEREPASVDDCGDECRGVANVVKT
jgi:hypothetical protein